MLSPIWLFCSHMDYSPPDFSVHGISQARILEWVAFSFSRASSPPRDQTRISIYPGFKGDQCWSKRGLCGYPARVGTWCQRSDCLWCATRVITSNGCLYLLRHCLGFEFSQYPMAEIFPWLWQPSLQCRAPVQGKWYQIICSAQTEAYARMVWETTNYLHNFSHPLCFSSRAS